ncbi:MAG TPA: adenine deaminase C-terminal domain-containing protein, partial [Actinomycetes bacterium]|nr:adenine deaminase C-terminal domain-containing protein [Actinomycetes bacterium]
VAVAGERIALVGDASHCLGAGTRVLDCTGRFVLPGLVEPHFHVGGSQCSIERLAEVLVPAGTVALGTCFYEAAIVAGREAVEEQLRRAEATALDVLFSPFVASLGQGDLGASRTSMADLLELIDHPACIELREWNLSSHVPELREVYLRARARGAVIGGHLEGLAGPALSASAALGARSDHETSSAAEALEKVRAGVTVQIREGSGARDLVAVTRAITEHGADPARFALTVDQQELWSIAERGHLDDKLRMVVGQGVGPIDAVRMATINAARSLGVDDRYGAVAPGFLASVLVVDDLRRFTVEQVVARGRLVAEHGRYLPASDPAPYPAPWSQTVHVPGRLRADDFRLRPTSRRLRVIGVTPGSLLAEELEEDVELRGGMPLAEHGLAAMAVLDRHEGSGRVGRGLVRGLGLRAGAVAATVTPGMVNLMVIGVDAADMALAANRLVELQGGIVVVVDGEVRAEVALPLFGLVSADPLEQTLAACRRVAAAVRDDLGAPDPDVLSNAAFVTLPRSIPRLKLCDHGLVRVSREGSRERVSFEVDDLAV